MAATKSRQAIQDNRQALLADQASPVEGNAQGKVTIVEFFDYRCVHCRHVAPTIDQIVSSKNALGFRLSLNCGVTPPAGTEGSGKTGIDRIMLVQNYQVTDAYDPFSGPQANARCVKTVSSDR